MYATVSHVETYHPARAPFTATTKPSATQVVGVIGDVEADVDTKLLAAGYSVPVDSSATAAFLWVRAKVAVIAADRVERIAPSSPDVDHYQKMAEEAWAALCADDLQLPGLARDEAESAPRWPTPSPTALFTRDMEL